MRLLWLLPLKTAISLPMVPHEDNPLLTAPNAYLTPHIAWATKEARERLMETCVRNLRAFAAGKAINKV